MFGNVNYTFYSDTLGRSAVPDESAFNEHALKAKLFVKSLIDDGIIIGERTENGIDTATCMMIEIDYQTAQAESGAGADGENGALASESIQGYSYSYDRTAQQEAAKLNAKSAAAKKYEWLEMCCYLHKGWRP